MARSDGNAVTVITDQGYRRALWALVLLALAVRVIGLNWDHGRGLHPDEGNLIRAALTLGVGGRLIPEFHAYNDFSLWLPRLLSWPFCAVGDGSCLTLVARGVSAVFSAAMVPVGAALACAIAGRIAGLAAAFVLALSVPLIQWGHFGTTESVMAFLVLLIWWLCVRWQRGVISDLDMVLYTALALGIGFGFKTTALSLGIMPAVALALAGRPSAAQLRLIPLFVAVLAVQAVVFAPSVLFATRDWLDVMRFENGVVQGTTPVFWTEQFVDARNIRFELAQLWSLTQGAGLVLAIAGLALTPRAAWRLIAPGVVFALVYAALTFGWHAKFTRYLAPLIPVLLVLGAVAVGRLAVFRLRAPFFAALAGVGVMGLAGVDHASSYLRADPRVAAEARLMTLSQPGDRVGIEPRDLPQTGDRPRIVLPLVGPDVTPERLAHALSQVEWLVIASRRNYGVLPRQPNAPSVICSYYAALAEGSLGFFPAARTDRRGLLGRLFAPGPDAEETRVVFDRPDVFIMRNVARFSAEQIQEQLSQPRPAGSCTIEAMHQAQRRGA